MNILNRGTIFEFNNGDSISRYILAESFEKGFVFQIICISGYDSGTICGYVKKDDLIEEYHKGISYEHLTKEINRNFLNVIEKSIKIFED